MIYPTTFIFTLLLAHIARAMPACGDVYPPEDLYGPIYDDEQLFLPTYKASWDPKYDNGDGETKNVACSNLAPDYPYFKNFTNFPNIGAARGRCGTCWEVTNKKTGTIIYITGMDAPKPGFEVVVSEQAFKKLNRGTLVPTLDVDVDPVASHICGYKSID
jgi:hypothetical protein